MIDPGSPPRPPLAGVRIIDLSRLLPGGYCSQLLADLGADVIKVEDPAVGDYVRDSGPRFTSHDGDSTSGAYFLALNRSKRSVGLDLKTAGGREILERLLGTADVLLESFRPGTLERLGFGPDRLGTAFPRLVVCSISGYGSEPGPFRDRAGHDLNYLALAGLLDLNGATEGPPLPFPTQIADIGGALMAAVGILSALHDRERTGQGQAVDVSMCHGVFSWLSLVIAELQCQGDVPARGALELGGALARYRTYRCSDGWVSLGAVEAKFWARLCTGLGRQDLLAHHDAPADSATAKDLETIFLSRSRADWAAFSEEWDCCLEPVLDPAEALASGLMQHRPGAVVELDQPGIGRVLQPGQPIRFSRASIAEPSRAPALGADSAAVLGHLGYSDEDMSALMASGALGAMPQPTERTP